MQIRDMSSEKLNIKRKDSLVQAFTKDSVLSAKGNIMLIINMLICFSVHRYVEPNGIESKYMYHSSINIK